MTKLPGKQTDQPATTRAIDSEFLQSIQRTWLVLRSTVRPARFPERENDLWRRTREKQTIGRTKTENKEARGRESERRVVGGEVRAKRRGRGGEKEKSLEKPCAINVRSGEVSLGFYGFSGERHEQPAFFH